MRKHEVIDWLRDVEKEYGRNLRKEIGNYLARGYNLTEAIEIINKRYSYEILV